jgi:hypothetical protein
MAVNAPTTDEVFASSHLKWRKLGVADAPALAEPLAEAVAYVAVVTGRYFDDQTPPRGNQLTAPEALAGTTDLVPLARKAVRMRTEQIVKHDQPGYVDTVTDDMVASFTAGPYSESRHDPTRRGETKMLNSWPGLSEILWLLVTEERYDYWISYLMNIHAPAFAVEEVDWSLVGKDFAFGSASFPSGSSAYAPWATWI